MRTARRHSLCADDAHDAYQRALEILMRRASTLDPGTASRWLHVVVKHEAMAVRQARLDIVSPEEVDFDRHESPDVGSPEDRAISADRVDRAAEALQRLKPQELRAMWLKALGNSYQEICAETGWTRTKVNRCLAEGRKSFLEKFAGIEAGEECERWQPVLSAVVDGEATPQQLSELRPHIRHCAGCRGTLRSLRDAQASLGAVLPAGVVVGGVAATGDGPGVLARLLESWTATVHERATTSAMKIQAFVEASSAGKVAAVAASAAVAGGSVAVVGKSGDVPYRPPKPPAASRAVVSAPTQPAPFTPTTGSAATRTAPASPTPSSKQRRRKATKPKRARAAVRREFAPTGSATTSAEFSPEPPPATTPPTTPPRPTRSTPPPMNGGEFDP
jgi:RNA polymerase sigma factor (sigma-70 family)